MESTVSGTTPWQWQHSFSIFQPSFCGSQLLWQDSPSHGAPCVGLDVSSLFNWRLNQPAELRGAPLFVLVRVLVPVVLGPRARAAIYGREPRGEFTKRASARHGCTTPWRALKHFE